jgi:small subunit ribosomal protein S2
MTVKVSLKDLIESGAHFGHQSKRWNPKMEEYIYGEKEGVHIFDLTKTKEKLEEALEFLKKAASEGKIILIVGTKKQAKDKVEETAKGAGIYYVNERWLGGTLTNFEQIKKSLRRMDKLKIGLADGEFTDRTKKERLLIDRDVKRLERFFGGMVGLTEMPEVLIIIDVKREHTALKEANMKNLTTVALVDTNSDPTGVDYPIPMNDDASKALEYVLGLMGEAISEGKGKKKETKSTGKESVDGTEAEKAPIKK